MTTTRNLLLFDCFNTLIHPTGPASISGGLGLVSEIPVEAGLYESSSAFLDSYENWRARRNQEEGWIEVLLPDRLKAIFLESNAPSELATQLALKMTVEFERLFPQHLELSAGCSEMLELWEPVAQLGVVSNFFLEDWVNEVLTSFSIRSFFDLVIESASLGFRKPASEVYFAALQAAGGSAERAIFVGDSHTDDIEGPRLLGFKTVLFDPNRREDVGTSLADLVIHDWSQLSPENPNLLWRFRTLCG